MNDLVKTEEFKAEIEKAEDVQTAEKFLEQLHNDIEAIKGMDENVKDILSSLSNVSNEFVALKSGIEDINKNVLPEEACARLGNKLDAVLNVFVDTIDKHVNSGIAKLNSSKNAFVAAVGNKIEEETGKLESRISEAECKTEKIERKLDSQEQRVVVPDVWFYFMCISFVMFMLFLGLVSFANMTIIHSEELTYFVVAFWGCLLFLGVGVVWFQMRRKKKRYY